MMHDRLRSRLLPQAKAYVESLSQKDKSKVLAGIAALEVGNFALIRTKQLQGQVRELIVQKHRITYFTIDSILYLVRAFTKKTKKTPRVEIEYAAKMYVLLTKNKV